MSDAAFVAALAAISLFWAHMIYKAVRFGEFRRLGQSGWFRREDEPFQFAITLFLMSLTFVMLLSAIVWTLLGRPKV